MKKRVVIVIEVANRELDNALLLKCELEKRGYCVKLLNKTEQFSLLESDILIIPNCYTTDNYDFYRYRFNCKTGKMICMQYEQVLSKDVEASGFYIPKGKATKVLHLCWGKKAKNMLVGSGIPQNRTPIVGAIQLDTTREQFRNYWYSRKDVATKYDLDINKKWILYISSFACAEENLINEKQKDVFDLQMVNRFRIVSAQSQKKTLDWMERYLQANDDGIIIYRPHPVELSSMLVMQMQEKYGERFRCISDLSVKQWIYVSNVITTWFSTAIVESYFFGKNCLIVRPEAVPEEDDCLLYNDCNVISNYEQFEEAIKNYNSALEYFPIKRELISAYYEQSEIPSYVQIANIVDLLSAEKSDKEKMFWLKRKRFLIKNNIILKVLLKKIYQFLYKYLGFKINNEILRNKIFIEEWEKSVDNNLNNREEIQRKLSIISAIINN